jgi:hypothetical protein
MGSSDISVELTSEGRRKEEVLTKIRQVGVFAPPKLPVIFDAMLDKWPEHTPNHSPPFPCLRAPRIIPTVRCTECGCKDELDEIV